MAEQAASVALAPPFRIHPEGLRSAAGRGTCGTPWQLQRAAAALGVAGSAERLCDQQGDWGIGWNWGMVVRSKGMETFRTW